MYNQQGQNEFDPNYSQNNQSGQSYPPNLGGNYQPEKIVYPTSNYPGQNQQMYSEENYGPRSVSFFTLVLKTFFGFAGGAIGAVILLLIFLLAASVLEPVLRPTESTIDQLNPIFIVILMGMIFATALVSSLISPFLLAYTERERYPRIGTALFQIFIVNLVVFAFAAPIYLSSSVTTMEFIGYAAGLQIVLVSLAATLIMEIVNDTRYPLLAVYNSIIAILVAVAINLVLFKLSSPTVLLFAVLPITWAVIGFFQAAGTIFYRWYYLNWGVDILLANQSFGSEYANTAQEIEEQEEIEKLPGDSSGEEFFKK